MASSTRHWKSRDDFKKQKELEELRKAGEAPAEVDAETGESINPHIPQYISQAPWYIDKGKPTLGHQRQVDGGRQMTSINKKYYNRSQKGSRVSVYRKGACTNCGAMTHKAKECMERPRKVGAKYTNEKIARDEVIFDDMGDLNWEGKRDRWNGFDPSQHNKVVRHFQLMEEERKKLKEERLDEQHKEAAQKAAEKDDSDDDDDDVLGVKESEDTKMIGKRDATSRTSVRHLRIREDTAKYLRNLDVNSAYYDPKTRSMRQNPNPDANPDELDFAGDNFVRFKGDRQTMADVEKFAWNAYEHGEDVHSLAAPSQAELLHREFKVKKDKLKENQKEAILERYGGKEHLKVPPKELLLAQTEEYVEYSRDGKITKGQEILIPKSKYEEDVHPQNHTSVFGSFYDKHAHKWGYACCRQTLKNAYCYGEKGAAAKLEVEKEMEMQMAERSMPLVQARAEETKEERKVRRAAEKAKKVKEEEEKAKRFEEALKREERIAKGYVQEDERKRTYNSLGSNVDVSEEDMEAWRMKRSREEDPMAKLMDSGELLPLKKNKK